MFDPPTLIRRHFCMRPRPHKCNFVSVKMKTFRCVSVFRPDGHGLKTQTFKNGFQSFSTFFLNCYSVYYMLLHFTCPAPEQTYWRDFTSSSVITNCYFLGSRVYVMSPVWLNLFSIRLRYHFSSVNAYLLNALFALHISPFFHDKTYPQKTKKLHNVFLLFSSELILFLTFAISFITVTIAIICTY